MAKDRATFAGDWTEVRQQIRKILIDDATLIALLDGQPRVFYLRVRVPAERPAVTFFDFGDRPDSTVPYHVRTLAIDIWADDFEKAEAIASRIRFLLDHQPIPIPSGLWVINNIFFENEREAPLEEGDIVQKSLEFRFSAYDVT